MIARVGPGAFLSGDLERLLAGIRRPLSCPGLEKFNIWIFFPNNNYCPRCGELDEIVTHAIFECPSA